MARLSTRRLSTMYIAATILLVAIIGGLVLAASAGSPPVRIERVASPSFEDDPNPPPIPADKAAYAELSQDSPRNVVVDTECHEDQDDVHEDEAVAAVPWAPDFEEDPNTWRCVQPDGTATSIHMDGGGLESLEQMREWLIDERAKDENFVPTVRVTEVPADCETPDGYPTIEEFEKSWSVFVVMNDDGSVKTLEQVRAEFDS